MDGGCGGGGDYGFGPPLRFGDFVSEIAFSPDAQWLALVDGEPSLRIVRWPSLLDALLANE